MAGGVSLEEGIHWLHIAGSLGPTAPSIQGFLVGLRTGPTGAPRA
jgi:hypothetical protein